MKRFNSSTSSSGPALAQAGPPPFTNADWPKNGQVLLDGCFPRISSLQYGNQSAQERRPALVVPSALGSGRNPLPYWKQAVDCIGCLVGLPLLAMGTVAWSVVASYSSPGPILYLQERVGYMGRRFWLYQFRTMSVGATRPPHGNPFDGDAPIDALIVTAKSRRREGQMPCVWLLRSTAFDKLPQILNVLRGEMSLVGPRPSTPTELERSVRWQRERCDTLPGLTGLGQVSRAEGTTPDEITRMDIRYVRTMSFWLDVRVLLRSVPYLLARTCQAHRSKPLSIESTDSCVSLSSGRITPSTTGSQYRN
jgi:lipopolysaccharide/colanic/teichoic acid biosynthesis glycosyltransferase